MRAATVLGIEPNALWKQIIPMQVVGIFIALGTAFIWGNIEKKRGAGTSSAEKIEYGGIEDEAVTDSEKNELARPKPLCIQRDRNTGSDRKPGSCKGTVLLYLYGRMCSGSFCKLSRCKIAG